VEHDSRFAAFRQLIDRIEAINRNQELPLDMAARREMAKAEKELADLQRQFAPAEGGDDVESPTRDKAAPDLVRDEALHVLADLAELWRTQGIQPPAVLPAPPRTLLDSVQEWIQNIGP
jgi:hypothetical protein